MTHPLGYILPEDRTPEMQEAHELACAGIPRFTSLPNAAALLSTANIPVGTKLMLTDTWKDPDVIADIGQEFTGFGQYDGSCVGVSTGNAISTLSFIQRRVADNPTKAFVMFWPFNYGRVRARTFRSPGEGAVVSIMDEQLAQEGFFDITLPGLPSFNWTADGIWIEGGRAAERGLSYLPRVDPAWSAAAEPNKGASTTDLSTVDQIAAAIINGCPVLNGCSMFPDGGKVVSRPNGNSYVRGRYDTRGGHATSFLGVWNHPNDGMLYLYSNQWPTEVYPKDPAGAGRCCVWLPESEVETMLRKYGGGRGETYAVSHIPGIPIQPKVLDMFIAP